MKKVIVLASILTLFFAGSAIAAYKTNDAGSIQIGSTSLLDVNLSKGVSMDYANATGGAGYSVATFHKSGTRTYSSTSGDAKIYFWEATNKATVTAPTGTAAGTYATGWAPM